MTLSNLFLTAKFEFVIISRHLVVKKGSQKSSVPKEFIRYFRVVILYEYYDQGWGGVGGQIRVENDGHT